MRLTIFAGFPAIVASAFGRDLQLVGNTFAAFSLLFCSFDFLHHTASSQSRASHLYALLARVDLLGECGIIIPRSGRIRLCDLTPLSGTLTMTPMATCSTAPNTA